MATEQQENVQPYQTAMDIIPSFFHYLSEVGYDVTASDTEDFITLVSASDQVLDAELAESLARPLVVKDISQDSVFRKFVQTFFSAGRKENSAAWKKQNEKLAAAQQQLEAARRKRKAAYKRLEETSAEDPPTYWPQSKIDKWKKNPLHDDYVELCRKYAGDSEQMLSELDEYAAGKRHFETQEITEAEAALKVLLRKSISYKKPAAMMQYLSETSTLLSKLKKALITPQKKAENDYQNQLKAEQEREEAVRKAHQEMLDLQAREEREARERMSQMLVQKQQSIHHRDAFIGEHNAVQSKSAGDFEWMDKDFSKLTAEEKSTIREYIRDNAREFRTRVSSNIRVSAKHQLDIPEICRKACQTGGIPLRLCYKKPVKRKTNLLLILDISGSCRHASEMMITFMYYMRECFSGACLTYVFVNSLYDVTSLMEDADTPQEAINAIYKTVQTSGVYSNYNRPFETFYNHEMSKLSSSYTFGFFIGDARNNSNPSGEEYLKAISRKCKAAYWLNTDDPNKWGQGDSIIYTYAPYMNSVESIRTPGELFRMIQNFRQR